MPPGSLTMTKILCQRNPQRVNGIGYSLLVPLESAPTGWQSVKLLGLVMEKD